MTACPSCGTPASGARFCTRCGTSIACAAVVEHTVVSTSTQHRRSHRVPIVVGGAVVSVVLLVVGLVVLLPGGDEGTTVAGPPQTTSDTRTTGSAVSSSSRAPTTTRAAPPTTPRAPAVVRLPASSYDYRNGVLVSDSTGDTVITVPGGGTFGLPAPTPPAGRELGRSSWTLIGSGAAAEVVLLVELRTPADGLDPETFGYELWTYELGAFRPTATRAMEGLGGAGSQARLDDVPELRGTEEGVVLVGFTTLYQDETDAVPRWSGWDLTNGRRWTSELQLQVLDGDTAVFQNSNSGSCSEVVALSATSGAELWRAQLPQIETYSSCTLGDPTPLGIVVDLDGSLVLLDAATGALTQQDVLVDASSILVDEVEPLAAVRYYNRADQVDLVVYDTTTWQPVLSVLRDQAEALDLRTFYLYGGYFYIANTDENPVLDARGGAELADGWARRPVIRVEPGYTLVATGGAESSSVSYTLVPDVSGAYPGPWF